MFKLRQKSRVEKKSVYALHSALRSQVLPWKTTSSEVNTFKTHLELIFILYTSISWFL